MWRLVILKMRQKEFQDQGEEGNSDSENEEQINCRVRAWAETGMLGRKGYPVSLMRENDHRLGKQYNVWERVRAL